MQNCDRFVDVVVEGAREHVRSFEAQLLADLPKVALVNHLESKWIEPSHAPRFEIRPSPAQFTATAAGNIPIPADLRPCKACLDEFFNPADRRHLYPFIACTHCGPRSSILRNLPYDRANTAMAAYPMCEACLAEYENPNSRRFHAENCACPACGPQIEHLRADGTEVSFASPQAHIATIVERLRAGQILAVKGVGGFQLVVDATNAVTIARLRDRKRRPHKAMAVMARNLDLLTLSAADREVIASPLGPIAIVGQRLPIAHEAISPNTADVGVFLPSSPLHYWLFGEGVVEQPLDFLVVTSGNTHGEPLCVSLADAQSNLGGIADAFVTHERAIERPIDDGVIDLRCAPVPLRSGRGCPPTKIELRTTVPALAAFGGDLKNAFALAADNWVFPSEHIGDLMEAQTYRRLEQVFRKTCGLCGIDPRVIVVDAHPGYVSSTFGRSLASARGLRLIEVQHHLAHVASVMADLQVDRAVGLSFDGSGYGLDGALWGGECLVVDLNEAHWSHAGGFSFSGLPGGDEAVLDPGRQAFYRLWALGAEVPPWLRRRGLERLVASAMPIPRTSSVGRLFDAVAALLIPTLERITYEGQAAILLEQLASRSSVNAVSYELIWREGRIDGDAIFGAVNSERLRGGRAENIAARFHRTIANAGAILAEGAAGKANLDQVVLSGGVMQNRLVRGWLEEDLRARKLTPLVPRRTAFNDAGLALGQAAWAASMLAREATNA